MEKVTSTLQEVRRRLEDQHRRIEDMLATLRAAKPADRARAYVRLRAFLALHEEVERRLLHDATPSGGDRRDEEEGLAIALSSLGRLDADGAEYEELADRLDEALRNHHSSEIEGLGRLAGPERAERLGELHRLLDLVWEMELSDLTFHADAPYEEISAAARREVDTMLTQLR